MLPIESKFKLEKKNIVMKCNHRNSSIFLRCDIKGVL